MNTTDSITQTKEDMIKLVNYLINNGYVYEDNVSMSTVYLSKCVNNEDRVYALTAPHEGNANRWMLRADTVDNIDRWGTAVYEQFYDTVDDFIDRALTDLEEKWN
jgi:hypothetical protein